METAATRTVCPQVEMHPGNWAELKTICMFDAYWDCGYYGGVFRSESRTFLIVSMPTLAFDENDPRGRSVQLTESCFRNHIQRNHPEITDVQMIVSVIKAPMWIAADAKEDDAEVYYRRGVIKEYPKLWMRVVVRRGMVVTAFVVGTLKKSAH